MYVLRTVAQIEGKKPSENSSSQEDCRSMTLDTVCPKKGSGYKCHNRRAHVLPDTGEFVWKRPKQTPHKKPWEKPRFRNSATHRIVCLVKSKLCKSFSGMVIQPQTHLATLGASFTFFLSPQLWCTLRSHGRTNATVAVFFSFSVINLMHPQEKQGSL